MLIVIEDQTPGQIKHVEKHTFLDLNDLTVDSVARACLRISQVEESETHLAEVQNDLEETDGLVLSDDKQFACWCDGVTGTHFTFMLA